jgi:hypothetical protein
MTFSLEGENVIGTPHAILFPFARLGYARLKVNESDLEYERSENDADDKYKEKVILVTGVVKEVYRGFLYTPYVDLEAGVRCSFSDEEDADLLGLVTGQTVSMKGRGDRLLFGVELRGCTVE